MPKTKRYLEVGKIYHVVLRRIADLPLFQDQEDYFRAIFCLYEFNTSENVRIFVQRLKRRQQLQEKIFNPSSLLRQPLVEILAFCLMPNHLHLLLRQLKEGGISKFIQKFASGYPAYFKTKYHLPLRGHFFQDRFLAKEITHDEQLKATTIYIHTNPISLIEPGWKEFKLENPEKAIEFLNNYRWSSYLDYLGIKNFPSLTSRSFVLKIFGDSSTLQKETEDWIRFKEKMNLSEILE